MKLSIALLATAVADDKKVPPRHPLQRLAKLKYFGEEILDTWFEFMPRKDNWVRKFKANADRMERNFERGEQRCGHYDANQLPHGGPARKRREADDDVFRYDREDPCKGIKQITTGYRKWAERYISECGGQRNNKYIVNRMNKWNRDLAKKLNDSGRECAVPADPASTPQCTSNCPPQCASDYPIPAGYEWHQTEFGVIYTKLYDDVYTAAEARALCTADAGFLHMPIPTSEAMNNWYFNFVGTRSEATRDRHVWLGINDSAQEGHFVDDLGNELSYTNWKRREPNDYKGRNKGGEDNVEMFISGRTDFMKRLIGKWNDQTDTWNHNMAVCTVVIPC